MLKRIIFLFFALNVWLGYAQTKFRAVDIMSNMTIEDVHIYIKQEGKTSILISNRNGEVNSDLTLKEGDELKITHIGYETLHQVVKQTKAELTFRLTPLSNTLDNVILTGEFVPTSKKETVYDVITVTEKEVERLGATDAVQVLQWQNGVQIQRDPVLGSSISINGLSGNHVKVIVDGVEMNGRSDGFVDLEQIQIQDKQSVEIVKGPVSLEYGSNAMGGVVQFVSHDEDVRDSIGGRVRFMAENSGTYKSTLHLVEAGKKHSLNLYLDRTYFDGWSADDVFWEGFGSQVADSNRVKSWNPKRFVNGKVKYDVTLNPKTRITALTFYQNEQIKERGYPFVAPSYSKAKDSEVTSHRFFTQAKLKSAFNDHHVFQIFANAQLYKRYRETYIKDLADLSIVPNSEILDTTTYNSYQLRYQAKYMNFLNHKIDYGFDVLYDEIVGERIEESKKHQVAYGLYIKDKYEMSPSVLFQTGLRISYFSTGKTAITPSISSRIQLNEKNTLKLSLSRGFRNPNLKDLYFEFIDNNHHIIGNSELKPEQSYHFNGGFTRALPKHWIINIGSFYNALSNQIELVQSLEQANWMTYDNFSKYRGLGGHIGVNKGTSTWNFNSEYQFIADRVVEDRVPENWVKRHQISSRIQATVLKSHQLTLSLKWNSRRSSFRYGEEGEVVRFTQEAFTFLDFGYQNQITKHLDVGFWVKNVLDVTSIANTNETAHSSAQQSIARGRMLQVLIGLKF